MTANENAYLRLAEHLERLPGGFRQTETGAELRVLELLFAPEEADLAARLTLDREDARAVAGRLGRPAAEVESQLAEMARKGLIFAIYRDDAPTLYQAAPWVTGIYEFQVNKLTPALLEALNEYYRSPAKPRRRAIAVSGLRTAQANGEMRTIPIGKSLDARLPVLPYEDVGRLVEAHDRYVVAPCICRREARISGRGCDAPEESCLIFGEWADYYARNGLGRRIDREEVEAILARANAANLVLQTTNSQNVVSVCCCCGCCCGVLWGLKHQPKPAEAVSSPFVAAFDPEACSGCQTCLERCQMDALSDASERVEFNADRCIGCGLCVSTCPSGALRLVRKPESEQAPVPESLETTWRILSEVPEGA